MLSFFLSDPDWKESRVDLDDNPISKKMRKRLDAESLDTMEIIEDEGDDVALEDGELSYAEQDLDLEHDQESSMSDRDENKQASDPEECTRLPMLVENMEDTQEEFARSHRSKSLRAG